MTTPTYLAAPMWVLYRSGWASRWTAPRIETALELGFQAQANDLLHGSDYRVSRAAL